ncbi:MAG: virginiamycin B lyase family protein [Gammaproteobacteria bacterium]
MNNRVPSPLSALTLLLSLFLVVGAPRADACDQHDRPCRSIAGAITHNSVPASGALISATARRSEITFSTFSGLDGRYRLVLGADDDYDLKAESGVLAAPARTIVAGVDSVQTHDLKLADDPDFRARIPSAAWLELLPDGDMKREFLLNCTSCHEIDAARLLVDGKPRTSQQWTEAFALMRAIDQYELLPPDFDDAAYVAWITRHLDADRVDALTPPRPENIERLANVRITEYPLPAAQALPHDLVIGPAGRVWITAFFGDVIWALDAASGDYQTYTIRPAGAEGWGQARALVFDRNGHLWIVLGGTHELVRLDPASGQFKTFAIGMYAHSLALDGRGRIWFNDYFARTEQIGVFDPATETVTHFDIPSAGLTEAQGLPLPYGLQIDGTGRLYSTQLAGNTVVMYDTNDGTSKLYAMPGDNLGPRRPAIGPGNQLWIPEWTTGHLTRFDPADESFTRFVIGPGALGGYDAETDPRSGEIWVTGALASSMVLFNPGDHSVLTIPLPSNPAYTRHLAVDPKTGDLWSAYSSLPAATPRVVRIER